MVSGSGSFQKTSIPPSQRKFVLSGGGREKKCLRMSEGGRGDADLRLYKRLEDCKKLLLLI